jgi:hypothetical protein
MWSHFLTLGGLATFKFMFAPIYGRTVGLTFWETYFATFTGGLSAALFFYIFAGYFIRRAANKRVQLRLKAIYNGEIYIEKSHFTFVNKLIIRMKRKIGIYGIAFYVPFFLSVPIGTIIVTKFYGKKSKTFPLIALGMAMNAFITTSIIYWK